MTDTKQRCTLSGLIFVSIASYRDPDLVSTVRDCLDKARHPDRLRFGICWQHAEDEELPDWFGGSQFGLLDVDYRESRGACWARAEIERLCDGEDWFLQLDSHHRFIPDWDVLLLDEAARTKSERPVVTTSGTPFLVGESVPADERPMTMRFIGFNQYEMPSFMASPIDDWETRTRPHRVRFVSGHFLFAPASFVRDVPSDPNLYIAGEEITLSVRAYTHGYDLFEPSRLILWHAYDGSYRRRHWDDHLGDGQPAWYDRDAASRQRVRRLLLQPEFGRFGLGTKRTLEEYEAYAGISFRHRNAQDYTRLHLEPPNPPARDDWPLQVEKHRVEIPVDVALFPADSSWIVRVDDDRGNEIYQRYDTLDAYADHHGRPTTIVAEFESQARPAMWTLNPHTRTHGLLPLSGPATSVEASCPAQTPGLTWEPAGDHHIANLPGETPRKHELNSSGALLIELADGGHSIRDIATFLRREHRLVDDPVDSILEFYERAQEAGLVTMGSPPTSSDQSIC